MMASAGALMVGATGAVVFEHQCHDSAVLPVTLNEMAVTHCESSQQDTVSDIDPAPVSSWRRLLNRWHLRSLPPPPRRLIPHDPDLTLTSRQIQRRARDEAVQQSLLEQISKTTQEFHKQDEEDHDQHRSVSREVVEQRQKQMRDLHQKWLDVVYGPNITLKERQDFLERYGCTGWTESVLLTLLDIGSRRGFVELGCGNGQWARCLSDRYTELAANDSSESGPSNQRKKRFDFVIAYDDGSRLPLNPEIYHAKTVPAHRYFFPKVQPLHGDSVAATVKQWQCRGRVLLLVYPPAGSDMAFSAVRAYDETATPTNKVVVYVGEGRGA